MNSSPVALVVEDDDDARSALADLVRNEGFTVTAAANLGDARTIIRKAPPDLVITDLVLPDGNGLSLLEDTNSSTTDIVFITGKASVDTVITALRRGAYDYLTKPVDEGRLKLLLGDIAKSRAAAGGQTASLHEAEETGIFGELRGRSPSMLKLYRRIHRVAATNATVLLTGETGTGKEVVARTIHDLSDRRDEAMVALNCGAISVTLIESELFGHEQGSFTGANRKHNGVFARADKGTLFLDEITEMSVELQVKLLRVLETGLFNSIGGEKQVQTKARVIAATNRPPEDAVREGKLREDLFYRLRVFPIALPPLRERESDVEILANHFLDALNKEASTNKRFSADAIERIKTHTWPGNVRELKHFVQQAFILADRQIEAEALRAPDRPLVGRDQIEIRVGCSIAEAEKQLIMATMDRFQGNKNRVAKALGISLKTLYSRLNVYEAGSSAHP